VAPVASVPSRYFYKEKLTNFFYSKVQLSQLFSIQKIWVILMQNRALEDMYWERQFYNVECFSERTWKSNKWWCPFRHNETFMRPTIYSEEVSSTCWIRFSVILKPVSSPRARIFNKIIWGNKWNFYRHGFERYIRKCSSD
jgi:hypothetical protein